MTGYTVSDILPQEELLAHLAEECAELGQAALKLRRVLDGRNPTPVSYQTAIRRLNEEIADVRVCLDQVRYWQEDEIRQIYKEKLSRWIERLKEPEQEAKENVRERC